MAAPRIPGGFPERPAQRGWSFAGPSDLALDHIGVAEMARLAAALATTAAPNLQRLQWRGMKTTRYETRYEKGHETETGSLGHRLRHLLEPLVRTSASDRRFEKL